MSDTPLILVVDDEPSMREVLMEILDSEGYAVRTADNGQHALDFLRHVHPDALILDLMMPVLDGWSFMESYCEVTGADIPVIGVSAVITPRAEDGLKRLGVRACLAKPFDVGDLLKCVSDAVRRAEPGSPSSLPQAAR